MVDSQMFKPKYKPLDRSDWDQIQNQLPWELFE